MMKQVSPIELPDDLEDVKSLQLDLAAKVVFRSLPLPITVAAVDVAYRDDVAHAAAIVMKSGTWDVIDEAYWSGPVPHQYSSGSFASRESAPSIKALGGLKDRPSVLLVDGHGIAHPRRFGLACHLGIVFDLPTVGCAKTLLCGQADAVGPNRSDVGDIRDRFGVIGKVVRTVDNVKPIYCSPGHKACLTSSALLVLVASTKYRIPTPLRAAHHASVIQRAREEA